MTLPPTPLTPPPHIHPRQQETYIVVDGSLDVLVGHAWQTLGTGDTVSVAAGTVHTHRNRSGRNVTFRSVQSPALGFERYLERLYWLNAMNRIRGRRNLASALYGSLLLDAHREDQVLASAAARMGTRALAQVAKLLGMSVDRR